MTSAYRDLAAVVADCIENDSTTHVAGGTTTWTSGAIAVADPGARANSPRFNSCGVAVGGAVTLGASETLLVVCEIHGADNVGMSNKELLKTVTLGSLDATGYLNGCAALDLGQLGETLTHFQFTITCTFSAGTVDNWDSEKAVLYGYADRSHPGT